jgi:hypothetical protein
MFLCEILTEQQQALPKAPKPPPQHIHVHVQQPTPPKEKKEPVQQVEPVQAAPEQNPYDAGDEYDLELDGAVDEVLPFQEILPMKRYYLIGRLRELKSKLDQNNIQNEDFDIIVKFTNNLSYGSLVSLASGIIPVVEEQLARLTTNAQ